MMSKNAYIDVVTVQEDEHMYGAQPQRRAAPAAFPVPVAASRVIAPPRAVPAGSAAYSDSESYSSNQDIAMRARPASARTSAPKLSPEITGGRNPQIPPQPDYELRTGMPNVRPANTGLYQQPAGMMRGMTQCENPSDG